MIEILVTVREVYGRRLIYPACPKAQAFANIVGAKCIPWTALDEIRSLGYAVKEVHEDQLETGK